MLAKHHVQGLPDRKRHEAEDPPGVTILGGDRAAREEVVPRFRIICAEGDWTVFVPLPDERAERERRLRLVTGSMAWKSATAFILSSELKEPDVVLSAAVTRETIACACRQIIRKPLGVGAIEWLPASAVGDEVVAPLPRGRVVLDAETEAA